MYQGSEEGQRKVYRKLFTDLLEIKKNGGDISAVTTWGIAENSHIRKHTKQVLFSNYDTPKDVYYEILQTYLDEGFEVEP